MFPRLALATAALLLAAGSASAQQQQQMQLNLDGSTSTAQAPKCASVSGNYALVDDNGYEFGTVSGSETKGTWHLSGTIDGTAVGYRSNWQCEDEFTTVYDKANGAEGPSKIYVIKYDDGSVGMEFDHEDGTPGFIGYLRQRN